MKNTTEGIHNLMLGIIVSIVGIVTLISIIQTCNKDKHQKSNRHDQM